MTAIREGRFGLREAVCFISLIIFTKVFYTSLCILVKTTGTAAWYTTLLSGAVSMAFFLLIALLMKRFPGRDLAAIFEVVFGKFIGKFITLVFSFYFLYYAASSLREFVEMIKAYALPYTPPSLILAAFILAVLVLASKGLEVLARMAYITFFPTIAVIVLILLLSVKYYQPGYLFPIGGYGISEMLKTGFLRSSAYSEVIILAFVVNTVHGPKLFKKAGILCILISGFAFSISTVCYLMTFDYSQAGEYLSPMYQMARNIYYSRFFQRIESVFLFTWVIASVITVASAFYIFISIYCKAFKIDRHRPLLLPGAFLLFMLSILPQSLTEVLEINLVIIRQYSMFLIYIVPILALIVAVVLNKKGEKTELEKD